jgi:predicted transposase/invertase (TIGR01784 family)
LHAQEYDASELENLLPGIDFKTAIETIEVISGKTKDKQMYDQREQAQRDYEWAISGARQQGREEGREEGKLAGKIQVLQELLGEAVDSDEILDGLGLEALTAKLAGLQSQLRDRQA